MLFSRNPYTFMYRQTPADTVRVFYKKKIPKESKIRCVTPHTAQAVHIQ